MYEKKKSKNLFALFINKSKITGKKETKKHLKPNRVTDTRSSQVFWFSKREIRVFSKNFDISVCAFVRMKNTYDEPSELEIECRLPAR
jgi:hypothetical protein